ncbi:MULTISPECIES: hypothetical protein [unclassified Streptomyces]|uniref:hypothetical protein n=1 Tax=unclassified Streptomyces TaxID=2593676 RepID=UPI002DDB3D53|nr:MULTISPECIES: hypothetical protein [unclassified Streptomyces]WSA90405.1 hypothetical protein OIE63_01800 [Streptomyces sp. NBC_01795]WSB74632.1 hypothetical protein OHB04_01800 [Streptomyces sp. NBC_01775]WSS16985.1 hypothetical protein OG533_37610 [Streptomyces sp. NBC_01186]WSS45728.1 hypothetical protein OG220_37855 [Streptomyces sp. NBC_01187]
MREHAVSEEIIPQTAPGDLFGALNRGAAEADKVTAPAFGRRSAAALHAVATCGYRRDTRCGTAQRQLVG